MEKLKITFIFFILLGIYFTNVFSTETEPLSPKLNLLKEIFLTTEKNFPLFPTAFIIDVNQVIWIVDTRNHRILGFNNDGEFITEIGGFGSEIGKFNRPTDITSDAFFLYIVDSGNNRVQKFNIKTYEYESQINIQKNLNSNSLELGILGAIAIDKTGSIYLTDVENGQILLFDAFGRFDKIIGGYGTEDGRFFSPNDVMVDSQRNVYVTDLEKGEIQIFSNLGGFIRKVKIRRPIGVSFAINNIIAVLNDSENALHLFSIDGQLLQNYSGEWELPVDIFSYENNKNLYLLDSDKNKVFVYNLKQ